MYFPSLALMEKVIVRKNALSSEQLFLPRDSEKIRRWKEGTRLARTFHQGGGPRVLRPLPPKKKVPNDFGVAGTK